MTAPSSPASGADIEFGMLAPSVRTAIRPGGGWFESNALECGGGPPRDGEAFSSQYRLPVG